MTTTPATPVLYPLERSVYLLYVVQLRLQDDVIDPMPAPELARIYGRLRAAQRRERDAFTRGQLCGMASAVFGLLCARGTGA